MSRRAGRPRKPAVRRQPNGRPTDPTRTQRQEAATSVVKAQRMARGATAENYHDQALESPVGRLFRSGRLGRDQTAQDRYESAEWYLGLGIRYKTGIEARKPYAGAPGVAPAFPMDDERAARIVDQHQRAIQAVPVLSRGALFEIVVCQNDGPPGMVVALLAALDGLTGVRIGR